MSNITLDPISAPGLGSGSYGANIKTQFDNINSNFIQIVEGEYLKGQSGDIVMLEQVDLADSNHPITTLFKTYIASLQVGDDGIGEEDGCVNSPCLYMIYTKNEETEDKVYKSSLPYTFLDPRFNPITEEANASLDKSCIIIYDEDENGFKSYNAFPNIYFNDDINEFCWKINNLETSLPARGPKGDKGDKGQVYMMKTIELESIGDDDSKIYELGFFNNQGSVTAEMNGCLAYIYCDDDQSGHISTMRVEYIPSNQSYKVTSILNASTNLYTIFSGNGLKDVLTEVKPDSPFNYLFIPSKFANGQLLEEAHVVTTKRSGDAITAPRPGFWWEGYSQSNWEALTDPNICIISPATINNSNSKRILPDSWRKQSGILYNNYFATICPGTAYFGRVATPCIAFDNLEKDRSNNWHIALSEDDALDIMYNGESIEDESCVYITNSSLNVAKNLSIGGKAIVRDLCYNKNGVIKSWMALKEPAVVSATFPNSYVSKSTINEIYLSGATFGIIISIGSYSKRRTYKVGLGSEAADGYDVLLDTVASAFNEFIVERRNIEPSNSSYLWDPNPSRDDDHLFLKYEGNKTGNPDYLTIEVVTGVDFELQYSYNPIKYVNLNTIKIDGNVEIPGKVTASELVLDGQNIDNKISTIADIEIQSLLSDYFTEIDAMGPQEVLYNDEVNKYGEKMTGYGGYRHPIQIWKSPAYSTPKECSFTKSATENTFATAAEYRIEIDLRETKNFISQLRVQTAFKAKGSADNNRISIKLYIYDLNGKQTEWTKHRQFTPTTIPVLYKEDIIITFKNNKVDVSGFNKE